MKKFDLFILTVFLLLSVSGSLAQTPVQTLTLRPGPEEGIDADIRNDFPQWNNGTSKDFIANAWTAQGNFFIQRSLLKFDLAQIPADAVVVDAQLYLFTNLNSGHYQLDSGANTSYLLRIHQPWSEGTVTWDNQPAASWDNPVILPRSTSNTQSYILDVTTHVSDMVLQPENNYGWLFRLEVEDRYRCMAMSSSDNPTEAWRPMLVVHYRACQAPVADFSKTVIGKDAWFTDHSSVSAYSWRWTFGDGDSASYQNPKHHYSGPGDYPVCLVIEDSCGTASHFDTVHIECVQPSAGFTSYFTSEFCNFTDTSVVSHPISWHWDFGDGTFSPEQNPVHAYQEYGSYLVVLTVTDSCGSNTCSKYVSYVEPLMVPVFTYEQNETHELNVAFQDHSVGVTWWLWDFGDGQTSSEPNPVHEYKQYGTYQVCVTAGNPTNRDSACSSLNIKKLNNVPTGKSVILYPNPCTPSESLYVIIYQDAPAVQISITDISGKTLIQKEFKNITKGIPVELDIDALAKGYYILRCSFNEIIKFTRLEKI